MFYFLPKIFAIFFQSIDDHMTFLFLLKNMFPIKKATHPPPRDEKLDTRGTTQINVNIRSLNSLTRKTAKNTYIHPCDDKGEFMNEQEQFSPAIASLNLSISILILYIVVQSIIVLAF